jgi:GntR family transcriptional regulator/MocR family aminotransferase
VKDGSHAAFDRDGLMAMLSVSLDRAGPQPLVRQLYERLRELILSERVPAGTRLPSTRQLSRDLEVSRTVTLDAFGQLTAEGFLETRSGAGHFVAALPLGRARLPMATARYARKEVGVGIWSPDGSPFDPAWQGVDLFPAQTWARMLGRGWRRHHLSVLERHWAGLPVLREVVAEHLRALRGLRLSPDQVMITSGNSDVLALIARTVRRDHSGPVAAWVEDPGLGTARQTLMTEGLEIVPVPVDNEGIVVAAGERLASGAALAVVTPTRQFPLGVPLSLPRRLSLLAWAQRSGAIVVDDDYDGEIRFTGRPLQSLASLDATARVLTLGSFSKLTFSGLRLGYAAGPADLIAELVARRRESYALVPTNVQAALAEFITTGGFARHLRQLRSHLTRRRRVLHEAIRERAAGLLEIIPQEAGMHLTVRLTGDLVRKADDATISELGQARGLTLLPLSPQYTRQPAAQGFLLGYAGWSEHELRAAADRLADMLHEVVAR